MLKKRCFYLFFLSFSFLFLSHFGSQDTSIEGRETPAVNFYGTLVDTSGNTCAVEYITIDHLYKQIAMYEMPKKESVDPAINTTFIDLSEIEKIEVTEPENVLSFNSRNYIVVSIISKDLSHTRHNYLVEKTKQLYCSQKNGAGPIEKKLSFQALVSLSIEGYKQLPEETKQIANEQKK